MVYSHGVNKTLYRLVPRDNRAKKNQQNNYSPGKILNAAVAVLETRERFAALTTGGFVIAHHLAPVDQPARDFVEIAERLEGTPYLWGGRTSVGLDCSALVQLAMQAARLNCPRDTDMQVEEVGSSVDVPAALAAPKSEHVDIVGLQRGDLVFWKGHVGIMIDGVMLLHANAHHMAVAIETLPEVAERNWRAGSTIIGVRRLSALSA